MTRHEYTEDDIFNALRRIPKSQVDLRLQRYATWVEQFRETHYKALAYNKRIKFPRFVSQCLGLPLRQSWVFEMDCHFTDSVTAYLDGTGWDFDSYVDAVDNQILKKRALVRSIKIKRRIYLTCSLISTLTLGVVAGVILGPVPGGILLGTSLASLASISHIRIAHRIWPYPEYHWRYK